MEVKKLATLVSAVMLCWNVALPIPVALASENVKVESGQVEEIVEDKSYFSVQYDGTEQRIALSEKMTLHLSQWKDEMANEIVAKVINTDTNGQESEFNIEIKANNERTQYILSETESIHIAASKADSFNFVERTQIVETTEIFMPIEIDGDSGSKEQLAIIDEFGTILEWKEAFQFVDPEGSFLTEEEYIARKNSVEELPAEVISEPEPEEIETEEETEADIAAEESVEGEEPASEMQTFSTFSRMATVSQTPSVVYSTHVQSHGWMPELRDGAMSGTSGQSKRIEAIKIGIDGIQDLGISYSTHVQSLGWTNAVSNHQVSGTVGSSKRVEAIKMNLTGKQSHNYDIYYRVHVEKFGWLGWSINGEPAGTEGLARRIEAIEIKLVKKGAAAPGSMANHFVQLPKVGYTSYVTGTGWQTFVQNGVTSGTEGLKKKIEAIRIGIETESGVSVRYSTHLQSYGWTDWAADGAVGGIPGGNKRVEALKLELTGTNAQHFDIYYRVHTEKFGWLGWAKNGEPAGTEGYGYRSESFQVKVVPKGSYFNRGGETFKVKDNSSVSYSTHVQKLGWLANTKDGATSGTQNRSLRMEALQLSLKNDQYSGNISYSTHVQGYGWLDPVSNGAVSGTTGQGKRLEAVQINLNGEISQHYDIYYRAYVQSYGWLGWAKNGMSAGTEGQGKRLESIQIKLIAKGLAAPSVSEDDAFKRPAKKKVVFLDVGHGGSDPGAQYYGVNEKDLNLQIGFKVQSDLEKAGYSVIMSRTTDTYMDYKIDRSRIANESGADIFISLHNNAMPGNSYVNGIETFYYESDPDYVPKINKDMHNDPERIIRSGILANAIHNNLIDYTGAYDRGVRRDTFAVLRETAIPAVLLEFGFMSNYSELEKLKADSYQYTLSRAVVNGVKSYFTTY